MNKFAMLPLAGLIGMGEFGTVAHAQGLTFKTAYDPTPAEVLNDPS